MIQDMINSGFEFGGGAAVLLHCFRLYEDRQVRGVSVAAVLFFTAWGIWNVYYYPFLGQFWSFAGGIFVTLANAVYVTLLLHYRDGVTVRQAWRCLRKWRAGIRPGDPRWSRDDHQVFVAIWRTRFKWADFCGRIVCAAKRRHDFPALLHTNRLCHCRRCHKEIFGRPADAAALGRLSVAP